MVARKSSSGFVVDEAPRQAMATSRYARGFTLIDLLAALAVIGILPALLIPFAGKILVVAKTSKSLSNLRALHRGAVTWAADNNGNYPVSYDFLSPLGDYWFNAMAEILYPEIVEKVGTTDAWVWAARPGYEGTFLRSPNAEPNPDKMISSYGYNSKFTRSSNRNLPACYPLSKTVMFGDNCGESHAISPSTLTYSKLNPRNGASAPFAGDGKAMVIYLDSHTESLDAERCKYLNNKSTDPFWGTTQ
jgi:type II secretory pathway pseudopilin PulG